MMPNDYILPPVPQSFFDEFGVGAAAKVMGYGHACAEAARAEITPRVVEILKERAPLAEENARLIARIAELEQSIETFRAARDGYRDQTFQLSADKRALLQGHEEQASEISRVRAEVEKYKADAERYTSLKAMAKVGITKRQEFVITLDLVPCPNHIGELDLALDTARKGAEGARLGEGSEG